MDGAIAVIGFSGQSHRNQAVNFEMLLMPLRHDANGNNRILGSQAPIDAPYWFGVHPVVRHEIKSLRLIWPDETPHFMRNVDLDEISRTMPPLAAESARRRGHLLVFDGGKAD